MSARRPDACRIVVTRLLPDAIMQLLEKSFHVWSNPEDRTLSGAEIVAAATLHRAEALLVMGLDRIDSAVIAELPDSLRTIATYSVGHNHIDLAAAKARGLAVISTPDVLSDAVADMAILLMLGAARRAHEGSKLIHNREWLGWTPTQLLGRELTGARLGILGMGRIGRAVAYRGRRGFGMTVHYHNRSRLPADLEEGAVFHDHPDGLFAVSDFLVLAAPSSPATRFILGADAIAKLPDDAVVVNVSRGDLVDDEALIAALRDGKLLGAGLDVFNGEPAVNPGYLTLPNVFLQPHQGSSTRETRMRMGTLLIDSLQRLRAGASVSNRLV